MEGIQTPDPHNILCGHGQKIMQHKGNQNMQELLKNHRNEYQECNQLEKTTMLEMVLHEIPKQYPPGRFLRQDWRTKMWYVISHNDALRKLKQCFTDMLKTSKIKDIRSYDSNSSSAQKQEILPILRLQRTFHQKIAKK